MMASMRGLFALALLVVVAATGSAVVAPPAQAQDVTTLGKFRHWTAYTYDEGGGNKVCYIASQPQKDEGNYTRRGEIYAIVQHRPAEGTRNVFSIDAGYSYQDDSDVTVSIDGTRTFTLFTHKETAWASDEDDARLVEAMKAGGTMVVKGTSSRGTQTTDTYSLMGFTNAYNSINRECP